MPRMLKIIIIKSILVSICFSKSYTPIVMWHGMGDTCCNPDIMGKVALLLEKTLPGVHVVSLRMGTSTIEDLLNGFFMHPDEMIKLACNTIKSDPLLKNGYNAFGISQGSQFLRGLAQRCPEPRMKNLITLSGQHQGVYGLPLCDGRINKFYDYVHKLLSRLAYLDWVQKQFVQATYWHNPLDESEYKNKNTFIAEINNERVINETYIKNLQALDNFVMVKYEKENFVQPSESSWFGFYKPGQSDEVQSLRESDLYKFDRLGLKKMDEEGKLHFLLVPWHHLQFNWDWFKENIVDRYLR